MPYALMRGGWLALGALLLIMPLFALSGQVRVLLGAAAGSAALVAVLAPSQPLCCHYSNSRPLSTCS